MSYDAAPAAPAPPSVEELFNHCYKSLLSLSPVDQLIASKTINLFWQIFNAAYPDFSSFTRADEAEKAAYLNKWDTVITGMISEGLLSKDPEGGDRLGATLFRLYLMAVVKKDAVLVMRIADALEPFNKRGHDFGQVVQHNSSNQRPAAAVEEQQPPRKIEILMAKTTPAFWALLFIAVVIWVMWVCPNCWN